MEISKRNSQSKNKCINSTRCTKNPSVVLKCTKIVHFCQPLPYLTCNLSPENTFDKIICISLKFYI